MKVWRLLFYSPLTTEIWFEALTGAGKLQSKCKQWVATKASFIRQKGLCKLHQSSSFCQRSNISSPSKSHGWLSQHFIWRGRDVLQPSNSLGVSHSGKLALLWNASGKIWMPHQHFISPPAKHIYSPKRVSQTIQANQVKSNKSKQWSSWFFCLYKFK